LCVPSPENEYIQLEFLESINKIMLKLTDKERFIVEQRLLGEREATLQELGDLLGLTRERIRQIYNKALKKLRFWLNKIAKEFFGKPLCFDW
jgi:RNA polymerase sigma factor (sigma-70 family)